MDPAISEILMENFMDPNGSAGVPGQANPEDVAAFKEVFHAGRVDEISGNSFEIQRLDLMHLNQVQGVSVGESILSGFRKTAVITDDQAHDLSLVVNELKNSDPKDIGFATIMEIQYHLTLFQFHSGFMKTYVEKAQEGVTTLFKTQ